MQLNLQRRRSSQIIDFSDNERFVSFDAAALDGQPIHRNNHRQRYSVDSLDSLPDSRYAAKITEATSFLPCTDDSILPNMFNTEKLSSVEYAHAMAAVVDEGDDLALPAADLELLLQRGREFFGDRDLLSKDYHPRNRDEKDQKYSILLTAYRYTCELLDEALFLCGRVVKGMEFKTELQQQAENKALEGDERCRVLMETIAQKEAELVEKDRVIDSTVSLIEETRTRAKGKADEERNWWQV